MRKGTATIATAVGLVLLAGCSDPGAGGGGDSSSSKPESTRAVQRYPDIVDVTVEGSGSRFTVSATISSPYDSSERYADAFRVRTRDGKVLGVRELAHPHTNQQPFTRSLTDLRIPKNVSVIEVQGRDLVNGWGGDAATAQVPGH